jgi:hypothetical protein
MSAMFSRLTDEYISLSFRSSSSLSRTSAKPQSKQTRSFGNAGRLFVRFALPGKRILISLVNAFTFSDRQEKQAITISYFASAGVHLKGPELPFGEARIF